MRRIEISLYDQRERVLMVANSYELNPKARFAKLWSWLWGKALRYGIVQTRYDEQIEYRRVLIDPCGLPEEVLVAINAVHNYGQKPKEILMGPGTFRELMSQPMIRDYDAFSLKMSYGQNRILYGVDLTVLPWMEGFVVR